MEIPPDSLSPERLARDPRRFESMQNLPFLDKAALLAEQWRDLHEILFTGEFFEKTSILPTKLGRIWREHIMIVEGPGFLEQSPTELFGDIQMMHPLRKVIEQYTKSHVTIQSSPIDGELLTQNQHWVDPEEKIIIERNTEQDSISYITVKITLHLDKTTTQELSINLVRTQEDPDSIYFYKVISHRVLNALYTAVREAFIQTIESNQTVIFDELRHAHGARPSAGRYIVVSQELSDRLRNTTEAKSISESRRNHIFYVRVGFKLTNIISPGENSKIVLNIGNSTSNESAWTGASDHSFSGCRITDINAVLTYTTILHLSIPPLLELRESIPNEHPGNSFSPELVMELANIKHLETAFSDLLDKYLEKYGLYCFHFKANPGESVFGPEDLANENLVTNGTFQRPTPPGYELLLEFVKCRNWIRTDQRPTDLEISPNRIFYQFERCIVAVEDNNEHDFELSCRRLRDNNMAFLEHWLRQNKHTIGEYWDTYRMRQNDIQSRREELEGIIREQKLQITNLETQISDTILECIRRLCELLSQLEQAKEIKHKAEHDHDTQTARFIPMNRLFPGIDAKHEIIRRIIEAVMPQMSPRDKARVEELIQQILNERRY